jgi:hypothetical protein
MDRTFIRLLEKSRLRRFFRILASFSAAKGVAFAACLAA